MLSRTLAMTALMGVGACSGLMAMEEVEIHGFASMGFLKTTDNNYLGQSEDGSLQFNEFGINFRTEIDDKTSAGIQLFSRDLGSLGNNEILIDWGFLDHSVNDQFGVRVGRVKLPGAMYNEYQDIDAVRGTILMPQGVYNLNFRDTTVGIDGIAFYGNLATESMGDFDYNVFYGVLPIGENGSVARAFDGIVPGSTTEDFNSDLKSAWGGNITWNTPVEGLRVALAYQDLVDWTITGTVVIQNPIGGGAYTEIYSPLEVTSDHFTLTTVSVEYTYNEWVFTSEHQTYNGSFDSPAQDTPVDWTSWYIQASYELNEKWMFTSYYMDYVVDPDDHDDESEFQRDLTFAAKYNVNEGWNIKAEIHMIDGYALTSSSDGNPDPEDSWTLFALKSTVSF